MRSLIAAAVLAMFCFLAVMPTNSFSQSQDPFEIGKRLARTGRSVDGGVLWVKDNWSGNYSHSFHLMDNTVRDWIVFAERPKDRSQKEVMWIRKPGSVYVKMVGVVGGDLISADQITRQQAEQQAWRILEYFNY